MLLILPAVKPLTAIRIHTKFPVKLLKKLFVIAVLPSLSFTVTMSTKSVSAGLDYRGVGPEHSWLKDSGRAEYVAVSDQVALRAFHEV